MGRDELVEELQALLVQVLDDAEMTIKDLHRQREVAVKAVTLRMQTERHREQGAIPGSNEKTAAFHHLQPTIG
jgi:hypothetical protein